MDYFIRFTWNLDGKRGYRHISTDDLDAARAADEGADFLPVTWTSVIECADIWTCTHSKDARHEDLLAVALDGLNRL
jgi:hypothetical protein